MAWSHILLNGHYTFRDGGLLIDLDTIVAALDLEATSDHMVEIVSVARRSRMTVKAKRCPDVRELEPSI